MQTAWFPSLTSRIIIAEITDHQKSTTTLQSHAILATCQGVAPHTQHIFHIHLCHDPHIVSQHPHELSP